MMAPWFRSEPIMGHVTLIRNEHAARDCCIADPGRLEENHQFSNRHRYAMMEADSGSYDSFYYRFGFNTIWYDCSNDSSETKFSRIFGTNQTLVQSCQKEPSDAKCVGLKNLHFLQIILLLASLFFIYMTMLLSSNNKWTIQGNSHHVRSVVTSLGRGRADNHDQHHHDGACVVLLLEGSGNNRTCTCAPSGHASTQLYDSSHDDVFSPQRHFRGSSGLHVLLLVPIVSQCLPTLLVLWTSQRCMQALLLALASTHILLLLLLLLAKSYFSSQRQSGHELIPATSEDKEDRSQGKNLIYWAIGMIKSILGVVSKTVQYLCLWVLSLACFTLTTLATHSTLYANWLALHQRAPKFNHRFLQFLFRLLWISTLLGGSVANARNLRSRDLVEEAPDQKAKCSDCGPTPAPGNNELPWAVAGGEFVIGAEELLPKPPDPTPAPPPALEDIVFLGIQSAYSVMEGELTLSWDPPIFLKQLCCRFNNNGEIDGETENFETENFFESETSPGCSDKDDNVDVLYHVFLELAPYDFFNQGDIGAILDTSVTTSELNITFNSLQLRNEYTALVIATIDGLILSNKNIVNVVISPYSPKLKDGVVVKTIPPSVEVKREFWKEAAAEKNDTALPIKNSENTTVTENSSPPSNTSIYNLTIFGDINDLEDLNMTIESNDTIVGTTQDGETFVMKVGDRRFIDDPALPFIELTAVDTYPTYIFERLHCDFQVDAFYDNAKNNTLELCKDYLQQNNERRLVEVKLPFNILDLSETDTFNVEFCKEKPPKDKKFDPNKCNETTTETVNIPVTAKLTAYLKVRVDIGGGFEAELGAGYDYLFEVAVNLSLPPMQPIDKEDIWMGKKKKQILFVVPVISIPLFITWQPFVAYDFSVKVGLGGGLDMGFRASGGDYAALVINGDGITFKKEPKGHNQTDADDIVSIDDSCSVELEATAGVRIGIRLRFMDLDAMTSEPAVRAGIDVKSEATCDGTLPSPPSGSRFSKEPEETKALSLIPPVPLRLRKFDISFDISILIGIALRVCYEIKIRINLGIFGSIKIDIEICIIDVDAEVKIDLFTLLLLTLPVPKLERGDYECLPNGNTLNLKVDFSDAARDAVFGNSLEDPTSWVLLFNDTDWSATSLGERKGAIEITSPGNAFCCGAADMPYSDLFLISTPKVLPIPYGTIKYDGTQNPNEDGKLGRLLQKCALEEFYEENIGDSLCRAQNCTWKLPNGTFQEDFCNFDGVECDDKKNAVALNRTSKDHKQGSNLLEEMKYLKYLKKLYLGFVPECMFKDFDCLLNGDIDGDIDTCIEQNCEGARFVQDIVSGMKCWLEPTNNDNDNEWPFSDGVLGEDDGGLGPPNNDGEWPFGIRALFESEAGLSPFEDDDLWPFGIGFLSEDEGGTGGFSQTSNCIASCLEGFEPSYSPIRMCYKLTERDGKIQGTIPHEILLIETLETVDLSHNAFADIEEIPPTVALGSLQSVDLRNNDFPAGYNMPCSTCSFFEGVSFLVDCDGNLPNVNCACCFQEDSASELVHCSNVSVSNHNAFCGFQQ